MISLLEEAKSAQLCEFPDVPHEISGITLFKYRIKDMKFIGSACH